MKKTILYRVALLILLLCLPLFLFSCGTDNLNADGGFQASIVDAPILKYDPMTDTTDALVCVEIRNNTKSDISRITLYVNFYDSTQTLIESRLCRLAVTVESGKSTQNYYRFASSNRAELNAVRGDASSVSVTVNTMELTEGYDGAILGFTVATLIFSAIIFFAPAVWHTVFLIRKKDIRYLVFALLHLIVTALVIILLLAVI